MVRRPPRSTVRCWAGSSSTPADAARAMGAPPGAPSHWVAHFAVADADAAVAAATGGGGSLLGEPMDTTFGRMAFLTDPHSAVFAVAGPPPTT